MLRGTPVIVEFMNRTIFGYLNPYDHVVRTYSREILCKNAVKRFIQLYDKLYEVEQSMRTVERPLKKCEECPKLGPRKLEFEIPEIPLTIFRNLIVLNISSILPQNHGRYALVQWQLEKAIEAATRGSIDEKSGAGPSCRSFTGILFLGTGRRASNFCNISVRRSDHSLYL